MSYQRTRLDRLTVEEADAARIVVEKRGLSNALRLLGVYSETTLAKAIARLWVQTATAEVIRARLRDHPAEE